jgi:hypothetical protein
MVPPALVVRPKTEEMSDLAAKLGMGAPGNVVVEMGIALDRLAQRLAPSDFDDLDRLAHRIEQRRLPAEVMREWDHFLSKFGWRGPLEMDLASPRYADDPRLALRQMSFMPDDAGFDPEAAHRRQVEERQRAYDELMYRLGPCAGRCCAEAPERSVQRRPPPTRPCRGPTPGPMTAGLIWPRTYSACCSRIWRRRRKTPRLTCGRSVRIDTHTSSFESLTP